MLLKTDTGESSGNAVHQCGLESSFVHFCNINNSNNKIPLKIPQLLPVFYWLALSVARKTLCCSWALSVNFLLFFLFLFSLAFGVLFPPGQCLMAILHRLDSAMVGHGIVSFAGFLTICRVLVSRPHLKPHVRLFLLHVPHSLQWPTSHPSTHSMVSSNGAKPSGHSSKQRPLCK